MGANNQGRRPHLLMLELMLLAFTVAGCGSGPTISRTDQGGNLRLNGSSFKPNEQVSIQITRPGGQSNTLLLDADAGGTFYVDTDVPTSAAPQVQVHAKGNQGSEADSRPG